MNESSLSTAATSDHRPLALRVGLAAIVGLLVSILSLLAALLTFFTIRVSKLTRRSLVAAAFKVLATLIGATIIAFMIGGLEVPHH